MDAFEFIAGDVTPGFKSGLEPSLFNLENHRLLQSTTGWFSFHLANPSRKRIVAAVFFCFQHGTALSPLRAPYGGIEYAEGVPIKALDDFIRDFEAVLRDRDVSSISLKLSPSLYHPTHHETLTVLLLNQGYQVVNAELGACLSVHDKPTLFERFDAWERRRFRQAVKAKLEFNELPLKFLDELYHFIHQCRTQRGHSLSMDYQSILKTATKFKNDFFCFGIYKGQELIAASIAIRVKPGVLYNFYTAHEKQHDQISPIVFLIHEMHNWCYKRGIRLLDLGTSALEGKPNFSLIDFKLRLGAKPAMKLTFEKKLN